MAFKTEKINKVYWALIKPIEKLCNGQKMIAQKINVRVSHDDMFRYATFTCMFVTEGLDWIAEEAVNIKNAPKVDATESSEEIAECNDYSNWNHDAEFAYKLVAKELGLELIND